MWAAFRKTMRSLALGKLLYQFYYRPTQSLREFCNQNLRAMIDQAAKLRITPRFAEVEYEVAFLTGKRFWYQSVFCAYSFVCQTQSIPRLRFYDDGTLTKQQSEQILQIFPGATIITLVQTESLLDNKLPRQRYGYLRQARDRYVMMRKIIDVFLARPNYVIYLDSDMLFWSNPAFLLSVADANRPCYMIDPDENSRYFVDKERLKTLFGIDPVDQLNGGIIGLPSGGLDYDQIDDYCKQFLSLKDGLGHFIEQTLWALLFSSKNAEALPRDDYYLAHSTFGNEVADLIKEQRHLVCLHYCWNARHEYVRSEWKRLLKQYPIIA